MKKSVTAAFMVGATLCAFAAPDVAALNKAGVVINDITARTIPADFERNKKIHKCYVLRRG